MFTHHKAAINNHYLLPQIRFLMDRDHHSISSSQGNHNQLARALAYHSANR